MNNVPQKVNLWFAVLCIATCITPNAATAQSFKKDTMPLIKAACIECHDADTNTSLDLTAIEHDLADNGTFSKWERVFDRVRKGEMPPASEERPDQKQIDAALDSLKRDLHSASIAQQKRVGRVPARRLTKREFGNTLRDLLLIHSDVTSGIPDEVDSGSFDTVGSAQRISAVHMESYLQAADEALEIAIQQGENPYRSMEADFRHLDEWHEKPLNLGGSITRKLKFGKGVALFRDVDYLTSFHLYPSHPGIYRLTTKVAAYQSKSPVTAKYIIKNQAGNAKLAKSIDLVPGEPQTVVIETFMQPGDNAYVTFDQEGVEPFAGLANGSANFKGRGLAILSQKAEGPIFDTWPPKSTQQLIGEVDRDNEQDTPAQVTEVARRIAPRVFRRQVTDGELASFLKLAKPATQDGRDLSDVVQLVLRSMLSSPQFLLFDEEPGKLNDYALANRLSYFLWKSMPDDELFALAKSGGLSDETTLRKQTERMLSDDRSQRFIRDFVGQWLRLNKINATSPDDGLYPEYDELLGDAMPKETELFFAELLHKNLSLKNLIDSDFTFFESPLGEALWDLWCPWARVS